MQTKLNEFFYKKISGCLRDNFVVYFYDMKKIFEEMENNEKRPFRVYRDPLERLMNYRNDWNNRTLSIKNNICLKFKIVRGDFIPPVRIGSL